MLQSEVKCKTQKRQDIKNWCLFVALTQFIFLLLYFLCAYVGKTGNVTISLQVSRLLLPVSLPYHTLFANSFYHDKLLRFDKLSLRKWPTYLHDHFCHLNFLYIHNISRHNVDWICQSLHTDSKEKLPTKSPKNLEYCLFEKGNNISGLFVNRLKQFLKNNFIIEHYSTDFFSRWPNVPRNH